MWRVQSLPFDFALYLLHLCIIYCQKVRSWGRKKLTSSEITKLLLLQAKYLYTQFIKLLLNTFSLATLSCVSTMSCFNFSNLFWYIPTYDTWNQTRTKVIIIDIHVWITQLPMVILYYIKMYLDINMFTRGKWYNKKYQSWKL